MIKVPVRILERLMPFVGVDDERVMTSALWYMPGHICATNGHVAVFLPWDSDTPADAKPLGVPRMLMVSALAACIGDRTEIEIYATGDDHITMIIPVGGRQLSLRGRRVDDAPPFHTIEFVAPKGPAALLPVGFDGRYLAHAMELAVVLPDWDRCGLRVDGLAAIDVCEFSAGFYRTTESGEPSRRARFYIMPMRQQGVEIPPGSRAGCTKEKL